MSNQKYNKVEVLSVMEEFFCNAGFEIIASQRLEYVYEDILKYAHNTYKNIQMPAYSQMRKIVISFLSERGLMNDGERLTTKKAYEITKCFYDPNIMEELLLHEYHVSIYPDDPIVCTIKLPSIEMLNIFAKGLSDEKNKPEIWGKINVIFHLCQKIKKKNPNLILAVIPEFSHMVYLNENAKIDSTMHEINTCVCLCRILQKVKHWLKI